MRSTYFSILKINILEKQHTLHYHVASDFYY